MSKHFEATSTIYDIAWELLGLSNAFYATGNVMMGNRMKEYHESLLVSIEEVRTAYNEVCHEHYLNIQANSNVVVEAVLAGMQLAQR